MAIFPQLSTGYESGAIIHCVNVRLGLRYGNFSPTLNNINTIAHSKNERPVGC